MKQVPVTITPTDDDAGPFETIGFVPFDESPLAVTRRHVFDATIPGWKMEPDVWCITHRPSGLRVGGINFETRDRAAKVLEACDPTFPAWYMVEAGVKSDALAACRAKFNMAARAIA